MLENKVQYCIYIYIYDCLNTSALAGQEVALQDTAQRSIHKHTPLTVRVDGKCITSKILGCIIRRNAVQNLKAEH